MSNFSFQLYSARNFTPWEDVYRSIASHGYRQVEGFGGVYEDPGKTRDLLDAAGLTMPSGHFSIDALENDLDATVQIAQILNCTSIFCPHIAEDQRPGDANGWLAFGQKLNDIGKRLNDKGYQFGWHNHDFEFKTCADGSIPMRSILEGAPDIDWEMDVAWVSRAGSDPLKWIEEFGSRITAVHVKDVAKVGENSDEDGWADVGHGTIGWDTLLPQISTQTKAPLLIAEHDNPSDHERFASRSIESLNRFI